MSRTISATAGEAPYVLDGLMLGAGDACIGINPASDDPAVIGRLVALLDDLITRWRIPTQGCVLTHLTTTIGLIEQRLPVDLVFQSIAGSEAANRSFGVDLNLLREGHEAGLSLKRGHVGDNVMYFETGQGSALSANAHHGVDQQTCEARAYAVARAFDPDFTDDSLEVRESKAGNYLGVTLTVQATSRAQLDALYLELTGHPLVKVAL